MIFQVNEVWELDVLGYERKKISLSYTTHHEAMTTASSRHLKKLGYTLVAKEMERLGDSHEENI